MPERRTGIAISEPVVDGISSSLLEGSPWQDPQKKSPAGGT